MNAPVGGESGGMTTTVECSSTAVFSTHAEYSCTAAHGLVPGRFDAAGIAGNCALTMQQSACKECEDSVCMQQPCATLGLGRRQIPSGAIIIPTRRMAIAAR